MAYRMIVLDLDDTLLRDDLTISDRTKTALMKAQEAGLVVVLASGRPTGAIWRYARELELETHGGWILSFNGAVITECATNTAIFEQSLTQAQIHEVYDLAAENGAGILSYLDDKIVTPKANPWTAVEHTLTGMEVLEVADFKRAMDRSAIKAIVLDEPNRLEIVADRIRPKVAGRMNMAFSKPFFLEFTDLNIDKRHSLSRLADRLGVSSQDVIAVGDGQNDAGMIQYAGLGVCMANGSASVRAVAKYVTTSNMDDGVAVVLEKFLPG